MSVFQLSAAAAAAAARPLVNTHTVQHSALQTLLARSITTHTFSSSHRSRTMFKGCFSKDSDAVAVPQPKKQASSAANGNKLHLVLLGAPGVGKGTFAAKIAPHFQIPAISTGDLVRAEIKSGSDLGKEIKSINDAGKLVGDDIIISMLKKRLEKPDTKNGFLLDGFPRRISQADALQQIAPLNAVLNITLREDILINKITSRRVCKSCGTNYNLADIQEGEYQMPPLLPKKDGVCDKDGGELMQRSDDTVEIVKDRLKAYDEETHPLVKYYTDKGILLEWSVKKGVQDTEQILQLLEKSVNKQ